MPDLQATEVISLEETAALDSVALYLAEVCLQSPPSPDPTPNLQGFP